MRASEKLNGKGVAGETLAPTTRNFLLQLASPAATHTTLNTGYLLA